MANITQDYFFLKYSFLSLDLIFILQFADLV